MKPTILALSAIAMLASGMALAEGPDQAALKHMDTNADGALSVAGKKSGKKAQGGRKLHNVTPGGVNTSHDGNNSSGKVDEPGAYGNDSGKPDGATLPPK